MNPTSGPASASAAPADTAITNPAPTPRSTTAGHTPISAVPRNSAPISRRPPVKRPPVDTAACKRMTVWIEPWHDKRYRSDEQAWHDPRSRYVEHYWLSIIGPTAGWLLRHIAHELDNAPRGFEMHVAHTALNLGVNPKLGPNGGVYKVLLRLTHFDLVAQGHGSFVVRPRLPTLSGAQLRRLPSHLRRDHAQEGWHHAEPGAAPPTTFGLDQTHERQRRSPSRLEHSV